MLALEADELSVPREVLALVERRQAARAARNWTESDKLREAVAALGWLVKDTKEGPKLTRR